jgi:hypothetical protein
VKKVKDWLKKLKQQQKSEEAAPMPQIFPTGAVGSAGSLTSAASMASCGTVPYVGTATSGYASTIPTYGTSYTTTGTVMGTTTFIPTYTIPASTFTVPGYGYGGAGGMGGMFTVPTPSSIISFMNGGKEIIRLNPDGTVTWANDEIKIDEGMEAFGKMLTMSAEMAAGVTNAVKLRMRDSVFEDLISIAEEKGALTAEELTYLLQASKIVEKLKGAKD